MDTSIVSCFEQHLVVSSLGLIVLIYTARTIYSVYFGPLAKFPGPKIAAATLWYEFYYDVILMGRYTFRIKEMHEKYGIRIPPSLIHPLIAQVQSSASVRTNSTSTNPNTTKNSTPNTNPATNTISTSTNSNSQAQHSEQQTTNSTASGAQP